MSWGEINWGWKADLNCRPHPYQGCALPTELYQHWFGAGSGNRTRIISLEGWGNSHYTMPAILILWPPHRESGGGGRIRTCEGWAGRFTVCSRWPLGYPSRLMVPTAGIELATYWLQVSCSTNWAKSALHQVGAHSRVLFNSVQVSFWKFFNFLFWPIFQLIKNLRRCSL